MRSLGKPKDRGGDETLEAAGKNECQQQRSSEDKSKNTGVKLQQLRRHRAQIGQQVKRSFAFAVTDNRLREENSIPVNAETRSDTRRFYFELIVCGAENRETLSIRNSRRALTICGIVFSPASVSPAASSSLNMTAAALL